MANFAVVVMFRFIVGRSNVRKRGSLEWRMRFPSRGWQQPRDHVLMFIVRKLNGKLTAGCRIAKRETHVIARRNF